jgi:signal transduction histidine kinase
MKMLTKTTPKSRLRPPLISTSHRAGSSSVPYRLALIDSQGNIVAVNKDWMALAEETGVELDRIGLGTNYLEVCRRASFLSPDARKALNGIQAVLKQRISSFDMDYVCDTPRGPASFHMDVTSIEFKLPRIVIAHREITEAHFSGDKNFTILKQFAQRLIHAQEEERQRISLEMHDDAGNKIALMSLTIRQIIERHKEHSISDDLNKILHDISSLSHALRDLSHGLHPPLLRYGGIGPALKWLCEKFRTANGPDTEFFSPAELPRLSAEKELCIFRVAQESLQNVVKHSGADKVSIILEYEPHQIQLTISDNGCGFIPSEATGQRGLGLLSMEARALCVRGHFEVTSSRGNGTTVCLSIPLEDEEPLM